MSEDGVTFRIKVTVAAIASDGRVIAESTKTTGTNTLDIPNIGMMARAKATEACADVSDMDLRDGPAVWPEPERPLQPRFFKGNKYFYRRGCWRKVLPRMGDGVHLQGGAYISRHEFIIEKRA